MLALGLWGWGARAWSTPWRWGGGRSVGPGCGGGVRVKGSGNFLEVSEKRFSEGVANITELLSAETAMREAQTNYLTTLLRLNLAELELLNARGEIMTLTN